MAERYNGVDMDHPSVVAAIQNMAKKGAPKEDIMRVVGVPAEVVDKHSKSVSTK